VDLRTQTSLFCGALALAIALSVLLRGKPQPAQWYFAAFAVDIGLWYIAQWLYLAGSAQLWARFTSVLAILMPQFALRLFDAIFPEPGPSNLLRSSRVLLVVFLLLVLLPQHDHGLVRGAILLYVFGLFAAGLWSLLRRGERSRSRATQRRVRFLVVCGALAASLSLADFLWFVGAPLPPVGAVLSLVFLFVLSESLSRKRLVDLYDMAGLAVVSTALAFSLGGIFYVFVVLLGGFKTMYLNAVLGGTVMLVLFEPLRDKINAYIHRTFLLERYDLEQVVASARRQLAHVLEVGAMAQVVMTCLEDSRRATAGALYLRDSFGESFELAQGFGASLPTRIESAALGPLVEQLLERRVVDFGGSEVELVERQRRLLSKETVESIERLLVASENLGPLRRGVCAGVVSEAGELLGLIVIHDERVADAFSYDDLLLLEALARSVVIVLENSRQHLRLQERARLAALGQMAAGLAHEVRNPLGAIKGAAQLLAGQNSLDPGSDEFVHIILEEAERLDRVVGSVLDYARTGPGHVGLVKLNAVVERTVTLLRSSRGHSSVLDLDLAETDIEVRVDSEQLKQVIINLVNNAIQAMEGGGRVVVATRARWVGNRAHAEVRVIDVGPGISDQVQRSLFVPFFTTKPTGTGLGLAISERIVQAMGGRIEVNSRAGEGATFTVLLPAADEPNGGGFGDVPLPAAASLPALARK
jgi:two-component system, NtrC family, sensor histidine kinase HydH